MSILTAALLSLLYFWGNSALVLGVNWWTVMRPLVSGFLAGVILGDPVKGAMVGAQINILYLGFIGAVGSASGRYLPCRCGGHDHCYCNFSTQNLSGAHVSSDLPQPWRRSGHRAPKK